MQTQTVSNEPMADVRKRRDRISWERYAQEFRASNPDLFTPWDKTAIVDAMLEDGLPKSAEADALGILLGLYRRSLDPAYAGKATAKTPEQREEEQRQRAAAQRVAVERKTAELETAAATWALGNVGPDMTMPDGRKLVDWTFGELRKHHYALAELITKYAKAKDGARIGDVVKPSIWKRMAKTAK